MPSEVNSQTVRAGVYARYSSDSQRDASIDDQVRICRAEIERHGWDLVQVYADAALSGASTFRPGYQKLL
jgi:site-specific DNA recombinase